MTAGNPGILQPQRDMLVLLLAFAGGGVDAVAILGFNVLTAAQTGNTILLAVAFVQGQLAVGISAAISVIGYVLGVAAGEFFLARKSALWTAGAALAATLAAELVLLGCFLCVWHLAGSKLGPDAVGTLVVFAAAAMGLQSVVVLRLHAGPTTTYITGTLTSFTTGLIRWLPSPGRESHTGEHSEPASAGRPWKYGVVWLIYVAGAVLSGITFCHAAGALAILLPMAAVAAAVATLYFS